MIRFRLLLAGLIATLVLSAAAPAWAWNDLGHITIAEIAWRQLSGEERQAVAAILKQHPHRDTYFKKPAGLNIPEDEWLFLRASTWCDYVRAPKDQDKSKLAMHPVYKFHHGPWHYIDYPYHAGEQIGDKLPPALIPNEDEKTDVLKQLVLTRDVLLGKVIADPGIAAGVSPEENKAVRLCWLFHLVGDLHQPLHTTALVDDKLFPGPNHDDAGGNFVMIRPNDRAKPLNLHAWWDGQLGFITGWRDGRDAGKLTQDIQRCHTQADLLTHSALSASKLSELKEHPEYEDWAEEGFRLSTAIVYDGGRLKFTAKKDLEENRVPADQVPIIPPLLQEKARATANKRVALAGYRLATQLQMVVKQ